MRFCLVSSPLLSNFARLLSSLHEIPDYKQLLGIYKGKDIEKSKHQRKEHVNRRGEVEYENQVVGAVLGHDIKERAIDPNPNSTRWRESFLKIGAFKRRSERVEVRTKEFIPDEELSVEAKTKPSDQVHGKTEEDPEHLKEFFAYADARLAEMDDDQTSLQKLPKPETFGGSKSEDQHSANQESSLKNPIEYRSMPFLVKPKEHRERKLYLIKWMPSGQKMKHINRFSKIWMYDWSHMWSHTLQTTHGIKYVPSSIRRFSTPFYKSMDWPPVYYVEDVVEPIKMKIGDVHDLSSVIIEFLEEQYKTEKLELTSKRKNKFRRTMGNIKKPNESNWALIKQLSEEIRNNTFRFDWETAKHYSARLYIWSKSRQTTFKGSERREIGVPVFGSLPLIKERYNRAISKSNFKLRIPLIFHSEETE